MSVVRDRTGEILSLHDTADAVALFAPLLEGLPREEIRIAYIGRDGAIASVSDAIGGDACGVDLPIRHIARMAVLYEAAALILAHNHPSGDPTPSRADLAATRRLVEAIRPLDIRLVDHLVYGGGDWRSFRAMGLL